MPAPTQPGASTGLVSLLMLVFGGAARLARSLPVRAAAEPRGAVHPLETRPLSPDFFAKLGVSVVLIVVGGLCAGLTIALMGQDQVFLQVLEQSGDASERKSAGQVLRLLRRGKHWLLITLLITNVIVNESLPIVFDSVLGGGWPAVVISTVSVVIFGEIIPQALCVRYGLSVGARMAPAVLVLMYALYPIAYPTALLLDSLLGHDEGTVYKRTGLKTLVALHHEIGADKLDKDEVTIISAVLDLKEKSVASIMTPISDVFTMPLDQRLNERCTNEIMSEGYSRIPVHRPGRPTDFVGMLLVKMLITYDPDDNLPVSKFALATLPETSPDVSCLDILNFFQQGKSHMVLVSTSPGEDHGAIGVVTLEDVIEELIGEEIIDETDVFIDVHKGLRRLNSMPFGWKRTSTGVRAMRPARQTAARKQLMEQMADANGGGEAVSEDTPLLLHKRLNPRSSARNPVAINTHKVKIKTVPSDLEREREEWESSREGEAGQDFGESSSQAGEGPDFGESSSQAGEGPDIGELRNKPVAVSDAVVHPSESDAMEAAHSYNGTDDGGLERDDVEQLDANVEGLAEETRHYRLGSIQETVTVKDGVRKILVETKDDHDDEEGSSAVKPMTPIQSSPNSSHT